MSPALIFGWLLVVDMALLKECGFCFGSRL